MLGADKTGKTLLGVKGSSPLLKLPFYDIVMSTTIDYMHSVCIGVLKQNFTYWFDSAHRFMSFSIRTKIDIINKKLENIHVPKTINRKPGKIESFGTWKANEYRNFLLYYGPSVLKNVLPNEYYQHFLLLSYSIYTFLQEEISKDEFTEASRKILKYVNEFEDLYSINGMRHNVHLLSHIPSCVINNGPMWAYSAFNMENKNSQITRVIKGTRYVVQEAANKYCIMQSNRKKIIFEEQKRGVLYNTENLKKFKYVNLRGSFFCTKNFGGKKTTVDFLVEYKKKSLCEITEITDKNGEFHFKLVKKFKVYQKIGQFNYFYLARNEIINAKIGEIKKVIKVSDYVYVIPPNLFESD